MGWVAGWPRGQHGRREAGGLSEQVKYQSAVLLRDKEGKAHPGVTTDKEAFILNLCRERFLQLWGV